MTTSFIERPAADPTPGNFDLCANAREIAAVIGRTKALRLIDMRLQWRRAGQRARISSIYIPKSLKPGHWLIGAVGQEDAERLVRALGGETMNMSSSPSSRMRTRDDTIRRRWAAGDKAATLASMFYMTERHIRNITRGVPRGLPANDNGATDAA